MSYETTGIYSKSGMSANHEGVREEKDTLGRLGTRSRITDWDFLGVVATKQGKDYRLRGPGPRAIPVYLGMDSRSSKLGISILAYGRHLINIPHPLPILYVCMILS